MFRAGCSLKGQEPGGGGGGGLPYKGVTGVIVVPFRVKICGLLKSKMTSVRGMVVPFRV